MDHDSLHERGRALEEEYFRKKDRELIEKLRRAADAAKARDEMGMLTGLDAASVQELEALGFTPDTLSLLPLTPLIQVAWAEGGVTDAERALIVKLARRRGITEGSPADAKLAGWLDRKPSDEVFRQATRLIQAMLETAPGTLGVSGDDLVKYAESIAAASGGILGFATVNAEEKQILSSIAAALKKR